MLYFALDTVPDHSVEIPNRAAFKASEVCEIAQIPPYVLRSWEKEFPQLGAASRPGGPRVYRRADVEQVLRIKQLVFAEGLTLAGARRKLEGEPPPPDEEPIEPAQGAVPDAVRARVEQAKQDLRSLLQMLSGPGPKAPRETARPWGNGAAGEGKPVESPSPGERAAGARAGQPGEELPLLDGTPDAPKARRARKGSKESRGGEGKKESKVE